MRHILIILSLFLFSLTIISCGSDDGGSNSTDNTTTSSDTSTSIDTTPPTVSSSSPSDGDTSVSITSTVSVTFSEKMDTSSVTTNTLDTSCFGTFQVSSDGFSTCVQMSSSPTSSNSYKTFTVTPEDNLSHSTVYRIRITTDTKDSTGNSLTSQWTTSSGFQTGIETTSPTLTQVTAVTTPTNDTTPNYTFSSTEAGTITYGGSCSSGTTSATSGNNIITLIALSDGTYDNCTISVKDSAGNASNTLEITSFTIETTAPRVSSVSPSDNQGGVSISDNISVTFSESMDNTSVTTNTSNTSCSGSIQLSSDNFSGCVQMASSPSSSNSNKTFTVAPSDNLSRATTYKIRVTTGVKDSAGNTLGSQYETSSGFITWAGTQQLGTSLGDIGEKIILDSSNNIYISGNTYGALDGNSNSGERDLFLLKYNSSGTKQWTKLLGTTEFEYGHSVMSDSSNNIYVTGRTGGGLDGNTSSGGEDLILVKYNSSGTKQWTRQLGSSENEYAYGLNVDSSNNIYITGTTRGGLDGNNNSGGNDIFLVKYNSSGTKQWTEQLGTSASDDGRGVAVDSSNNIYVTGSTSGGLDGNNNSGGNDIFLVKYNSSGTKQWTEQLGTSSEDVALRVTIDSSDNIYVTGYTSGGLDNNTNSGDWDIFLLKYNSSGTKQWTQQLGSSGRESGEDLAVDNSSNIYVTGNALLVKYYDNGTEQWTKQLGAYAYGVAVDNSSNIYVTGFTSVGLDGNTSAGGNDIFLMKFNSDGVKQ